MYETAQNDPSRRQRPQNTVPKAAKTRISGKIQMPIFRVCPSNRVLGGKFQGKM
jgi:hypothetical protein